MPPKPEKVKTEVPTPKVVSEEEVVQEPPTEGLRNKLYKDLTPAAKAAVEARLEPSDPPARTRQSLIEEAYANRVRAEQAEAVGDEDLAAHHYNNERICLEAAEKAAA